MPKSALRFPFLALAVSMALTLVCAGAGSAQSDSVAEAAKRARELKKNAPKAVKTVTNDNLPTAPAGGENSISTVGTPDTAAAADTTAAAPDAAAPKAGGTALTAAPENSAKAEKKKADDQAALERAKKELAVAAHELDVLQRKAALDSDAYYSKADYTRDTAGKALLDGDGQQVSDKQKVVADLKAKVAELLALVGDSSSSDTNKNNPPR